MTRTTGFTKWTRLGGRVLVVLAFAVGVVLLLLWLAGKFSPKVPTTVDESSHAQSEKIEGTMVPVLLTTVKRYESAVGSVRAVHETTIGSKLLASVEEVNVTAGQKVRAGEVLIRLDDTDLKARFQQTQAAVASIEARLAQIQADEKRYARLLPSKAVSEQQYEKVAAQLKETEAELVRAKAHRDEAQAALEWATIRSPIDGTVIDKKVEVGDMVTPGQVLVSLFDPLRMQLVSSVRESLVHQLQEGQQIGVNVETLKKECTGTISEIVPEARSDSRSFLVKVTGPCPPGIYSGMFGRINIPLGEEKVLVIPPQAVHHVGQLKLVNVVEGDRVVRRSIRTGRQIPVDGKPYIEVLSGLKEGEKVVVPSADGVQPNRTTQEATT